MSQFTIQLSPSKDNDGFVVGYPGAPPGDGRPAAAVVGRVRFCPISTQSSVATMEAKWVRIELRKIEIIPYEGSFRRYEDRIGCQPTTLWCSSQGDEYGPLVSQDFKFSLPIPESLPPSLELESGAAIQYEVIASICAKCKKKAFRRAKPSVVMTAAPVTIKKYELHPSWPIFHSPQLIHAEHNGYQLSMERTHRCFGPGDSIEVPVTLQLTNARSFLWSNIILQHFKFTLKETVIYRRDSVISPPVIAESVVISHTVPIHTPLRSSDGVHRTTITCSVPKEHERETLCMSASRHIDIKYTLCLQAVLNQATISLDIPIIISRIQHHGGVQALDQIGISHTIPEPKTPEIVWVCQSTDIEPNDFPSTLLPTPDMHQHSVVAAVTQPDNCAPRTFNPAHSALPSSDTSPPVELESHNASICAARESDFGVEASSTLSNEGIHPIQLVPAMKTGTDKAQVAIRMLPTPPTINCAPKTLNPARSALHSLNNSPPVVLQWRNSSLRGTRESDVEADVPSTLPTKGPGIHPIQITSAMKPGANKAQVALRMLPTPPTVNCAPKIYNPARSALPRLNTCLPEVLESRNSSIRATRGSYASYTLSTNGIYPIQLGTNQARVTFRMPPDVISTPPDTSTPPDMSTPPHTSTPPDYWSLISSSDLRAGVEEAGTARYSEACVSVFSLRGGDPGLRADIRRLQTSDEHIPLVERNYRESLSSFAYPSDLSLPTTTGTFKGGKDIEAPSYMGTSNEEGFLQSGGRESTQPAALCTTTSVNTSPLAPSMSETTPGAPPYSVPRRRADTTWYLKLLGRVMRPETGCLGYSDYSDYIDYSDPSPAYIQNEIEPVDTQLCPTIIPDTINHHRARNPDAPFDIHSQAGTPTPGSPIIVPLEVEDPNPRAYRSNRQDKEVTGTSSNNYDFQFGKQSPQSPARANAKCLTVLFDQYQLGYLSRMDLIASIQNRMNDWPEIV